ncbi:group II intron maturase-specific domain-containing protein [Nocardia gipuzkoensis]
MKKITGEARSWRLHHRIRLTFAQLAKAINPVVSGWMRYYGAFYPSALHPRLTRINSYLVRWTRGKYRRLDSVEKARRAYKSAVRAYPAMFRHWRGHRTPGEQDDKSPVTGDCHAGILWEPEAEMPRATRPA